MRISVVASFVLVLYSAIARTADSPAPTAKLAPGYGELAFAAPTPGSYRLSDLGAAADGDVLTVDGTPTHLHALMDDKIVLLSFVYSTCGDINGCPLALSVLHRLKRRLQKHPDTAKQLRLLTLSFNPAHDTPAVMQRFGQGFQSPGSDWRFLTTASETALQPILEHYQQSIQKQYDAVGRFTGTFAHVLRVYLIDRNKRIRNIYTVSYLHPELVVNDIETLLGETTAATLPVPKPEATLYQSGDNRNGYEQKDYRTRSVALSARTGADADLTRWVQNPPLGLPPVPQPADNAITPEKIQLGRKLFYDRRLSLNNTFSCAMCHIPEQGFGNNEMATAVGIEGRSVRRNAPTLYNVAYARLLFHDGRETTLEQQVWGPLLAANEMGNPSIGTVIEKIRASQDYTGLFERAFGRGASMETVGMAIASYERTLNSANSPFDRWYYGKQAAALSTQAIAGFKLFTGKAGCAACHSIGKDAALFTDQQMHNTGIGYAGAMSQGEATTPVQVAPGVFLTIDKSVVRSVAAAKTSDLGRYEITQHPEDRWKYRTPSLRNIALTAPYMHNGAFTGLRQVIEFYNTGGISNENLDPLLKPLHLQSHEMGALVSFLQALTGDNTQTLIADAFAAPIGDAQ